MKIEELEVEKMYLFTVDGMEPVRVKLLTDEEPFDVRLPSGRIESAMADELEEL